MFASVDTRGDKNALVQLGFFLPPQYYHDTQMEFGAARIGMDTLAGNVIDGSYLEMKS